MNVEQAREVSHAAHDSLFAVTEQLQKAGWSLCVDFVYVISEAESLMSGGF